MRKRIILLDTSFSAKPIYDYLISTNAEVYVIGGNPKDVLAKSVKNYINLDYSNVAKVKSVIEKLNIDYLVPGGNDFSYKICAEINENYKFHNIDSVETTEIINNKERFREFASKYALHVPQMVDLNNIQNHLPIIIKPVDAYSGHGMTVLLNYSEEKIKNAISLAKKYSKSKKYIIEEYVQGQLYSHSAFIVNGEIMIDFIVEEHCIINEFVVDTSRVIFDFNEDLLEQIRKDITKLAKELSMQDGLIHTQFICDGKSFWLIEVTRRCPGDLFSKLIQESTGFPYAEYYARPFINQKNKRNNTKLDKINVVRHTITTSQEMVFNSLKLKRLIDNCEIVPLSKSGDKLKESPFSRVGIMFAKLENKNKAETLFNDYLNKQVYEIL